MIRKACAAALLALLPIVGGVEADAQTIRDFPCQIDLGETNDEGQFVVNDIRGLVVPSDFRRSFGASNQQKVCQGQNVRLNCSALIEDWPFNRNFNASGFTCLIDAEECGIAVNEEGLAEAGRTSLQITATRAGRCGPDSSSCGFATLECRLR